MASKVTHDSKLHPFLIGDATGKSGRTSMVYEPHTAGGSNI